MTPHQIKTLRSHLCMTQTQFGAWLGKYGRATIYNWEYGKESVPEVVVKLIKERAKTDVIIRRAIK